MNKLRAEPLDSPRRPARAASKPSSGARRQRRALTHVGGEIALWRPASDTLTHALVTALNVRSDEAATREHVHGFHSYPARLHPHTARALIRALTKPGELVFDPFCGSGTVLVEARLQARQAQGLDLNPLSVLLSRLKCRETTPKQRAAWLEAASSVAALAEERRRRKAGPTQRYPQTDRELFAPHVLLELDSIRTGIEALPDADAQSVLSLVLSSILVKLSSQKSDTRSKAAAKRFASGFATRLFFERTQELMDRMATFSGRLATPITPCRVWEGDARTMRGPDTASVSLLVSSPPYPGVYDYHAHHALRLRWLGCSAQRFERAEMGAKRVMSNPTLAAARVWEDDLVRVLRSTRRVLRPDGVACFILADSAAAGTAFRVEEYLPPLAQRCGLEVVNLASQPRPLFHHPSERWFRARPRREHLVALRPLSRSGTPKGAQR